MGLLDFLKPKPKPQLGSAQSNDEVRMVLTSMGDDGSSVRHVVHYAYPGKGADMSQRDTLKAELKAKGFDVEDAANGNGFVMEHHRSVAGEDFDDFTGNLSTWFSERGWDYDGWECAVTAAEPEAHQTVH